MDTAHTSIQSIDGAGSPTPGGECPGRPAGGDRHASAIAVVGLVQHFRAPETATGRTRPERPGGYGVREQCVPFVAAAALGVHVPSPFAWGHCHPSAVPPGARAFRGPIPGGDTGRCFYVVDDPGHDFRRNRYDLAPWAAEATGLGPLPGLSFFERADQQHMIKIHLPYCVTTEPGVATLWSEPVNRPFPNRLRVLSGLVETDWYVAPVNLVAELPDHDVHVDAGQPIAQILPWGSTAGRCRVDVIAPHTARSGTVLRRAGALRDQLIADRSTYRVERHARRSSSKACISPS